jgi:PST family polysaccharide transporter
MRELDYKRKLLPDMGNAITKGVVSIGMAFDGFGVWSLVAGQLAGALVSVMLVWIIVPWRPHLALHRNIMNAMLKFGASVTGIDIVTVIMDNLDYVIVGRVFGLAQLSVYTLAYRLPEMLLIGNLWVMGGVIYPTFASIQDRMDTMRQGFLASVRIVELFAVPVCLGLVLAADPIVRVFFGEQWLDAIPILRVLAVYAWVYSIGYHIGGVYKAIGRPDILLRLSLITLLVLVPSLLIGSRFDLIGLAYGLLFAIIIRRIISIMKPSVVGAAVMFPITLAVLLVTEAANPFIRLAVVVLSGALSYAATLWWFEKDNLLQLMKLVRNQELPA